jgi:beta-lactamase class C
MKKYKYIFISVIIFIGGTFAATQLQLLKGNSEKIEETNQIPEEIIYSKEIEDVLNKFDSLYQAHIIESESVGGAVVISYKGQIAMTKCFGETKIGTNNPIDENTLFRLASVSKTITGVLAGKLAIERVINLDEKVIQFIPELQLKTEENTKNLTVKHLLSHTSGLIPHAYDGMVEDGVLLKKIINQLNEVEITAPPGFMYGYQNVMFSLFDIVVAEKTKKNFHKVLEEKVLKPFGMKNASTDFKSFRTSNNKAFPHAKTKSGFKSTRLNNRYYSTIPAAGINASISDMGNFLVAITQKEDTLFSKKEREIVFTPVVNSVLKRSYYRHWGKIKSKQYALGWRIVDYKGYQIAQHGGYISGYQSEIAICEQEEIGIAVLTNSPNSNFSMIVPGFLNLYFDHKNKLKMENIVSDTVSETNSVVEL